jgi:diguanylate cyclase (GGDEF)-like protein
VAHARGLVELARTVPGPPRAALERLLGLLCEELGGDVAFVGVVDAAAGRRTLRVVVDSDGERLPHLEDVTEPLDGAWCGRVVSAGSFVCEDVASEPELAALPSTAVLGIVSHVGVALRVGSRVVGTLCVVASSPRGPLTAREHAVLTGLAEVVQPWLAALDAPAVPEQRRGGVDLAVVAEAVSTARDVEELSRPLLDALHELTGLGSTYLTVVHEDRDVQEIRYSRNTRAGFELPEGLEVPWADTLCKRALDEGRPCTTDVADVWGDSQAAQDLGIEVYVSVPVALADGTLWGTLCAADSERSGDLESHLPTMRLFSRLIAAEVQRAQVVERANAEAERARRLAETDALTGCSSRRVVEPWLAERLGELDPDEVVLLAYVDVDDFKAVNDDLGHAAGDVVLHEVGNRLRTASRPGDLVARMGGDEFVVAAQLPREAVPAVRARISSTASFEIDVEGRSRLVRTSVGIALHDGSVHEGSRPDRSDPAAALLAAADEAMYAAKRATR